LRGPFEISLLSLGETKLGKRANIYSVAEMNATRRSPAMVSPALERLVIEGTPVLCATMPSH